MFSHPFFIFRVKQKKKKKKEEETKKKFVETVAVRRALLDRNMEI